MKDVINVTVASFEDEVLKSDKPVLVDFWAEWCGPCKMIAPLIEEAAASYGDKIKICKLDVDADSNSEIASRYSVRGIPTLMIFKNGEVESTKVGGLSKANLEDFIKSYI